MSAALTCIASRASLLEDRTNWTDTEHWEQANRLLIAVRVGVLEGDVEGQLVEALGAVVATWLECIHEREVTSVVSGEAA
jgi:hypothetical protein